MARLRRRQDRRGPRPARPRASPPAGDGQRIPETVIVQPSDELIELRGRPRPTAPTRSGTGPSRRTKTTCSRSATDGRQAALDLRLVGLPQTVPGKIEAAAGRIAAIWQAHRDDEYLRPDGSRTRSRGSLQIVFCDLGTPRHRAGTSTTSCATSSSPAACPATAIRFVHEAKNDTDKAELFAACRAGHVAVLVGSTEKMGVGTNVQARAIALHHLDARGGPRTSPSARAGSSARAT